MNDIVAWRARWEALCGLEGSRLPALRGQGRRWLLGAGVALVAVSAVPGVVAPLRALVGMGALLSLGVLPPAYAFWSTLREWSDGTAVWWLALPQPPWERLGAKVLRGLLLGWGLGVLCGSVFLLQSTLGAAMGPLFESSATTNLTFTLGQGCRLVLLLAFCAIPATVLAAAAALWVQFLRNLSRGLQVLATGLTAVAVLAAVGAVSAGLWVAPAPFAAGVLSCSQVRIGSNLAVSWAVPLLACLAAAGAGTWACRWLDAAAEVRSGGR